MNQYGNVTRTGDQATVRFERILEASIERVWRALTEPTELAAWLDHTTLDGRLGGGVEIAFDDGPVTGEITAWDPPHLLEFTWVIDGEAPSTVRFELASTGEATSLTLSHARLPQSMDSGYAAGWHAHLDQLEDTLAGREVRSWDDRFTAVLGEYRPSQAG